MTMNFSFLYILMGVIAGSAFIFSTWSLFDDKLQDVSTPVASLIKIFMGVVVGVLVASIMALQ